MTDNSFQKYLDAGSQFGLPKKLLHTIYHIVATNDDLFYEMTFKKISLIYNAGFDINKIMHIMSESIESLGVLNLEKFYKIIEKDLDQLNISKDQVNYEINTQKDVMTQLESETIPADIVLEHFKNIKVTKKLINKIKDYIVTNPGAKPTDLTVNNMAFETIDHLLINDVPESEIIPIISKSMRADKTFSNDKFHKYYNASKYGSSGAAISKIDGGLKIKINTQFLKYTNDTLKILHDNAEDIKKISQKYAGDMKGFAKEFYKFYITKKGFADIAPKLNIIEIIESTDGKTSLGEFAPSGILNINISQNATQEETVNSIVHETVHFEQYLWVIHTETLGLDVFVMFVFANAMIDTNGGYDIMYKNFKPDNKIMSSGLFSNSVYHYIETDRSLIIRYADYLEDYLQNPFYINAKNSKVIKPISLTDPKFPFIKQLAIDLMALTNPNDEYTYHKLLHEKMAFSVGNAAGIAFHKVVYGNKFSAKQQFGQTSNLAQR